MSRLPKMVFHTTYFHSKGFLKQHLVGQAVVCLMQPLLKF